MIPAGVEPVDAVRVARIRGVTLGALRNAQVLKDPDFPKPLNPHRGRDHVWDPAAVEAHRTGQPLPAQPEPSPDDLLDDVEAAAVVGVSVGVFTDQAVRLGLTARSIEAHSLRYWRRGDLTQRHERAPGQRGKPAGAKDLTPRKKRGTPAPAAKKANQEAAALFTYLAELDDAGSARPDTAELATRYGVSVRTIQRWLAREEH
ncbi:helix-turn-helix domain-containing protein [Catenulispora rubra]|uniref:helix-turn-helix domain-containing protein n=1 Tax=Catenulispora rubra TaxID=280293 RepID=UPI00189227D5|nr:helix-turn-helix domain-containing protein [Catenulispora rubra]